jgi:DNA-binding NarL/FixJ family response regulator
VRILIVDDHEAVRKGVCAILSSRLDIEICGEAVNGKEAIAKAKELQPDLIILDISMPVLSGFDAARQIRKIVPEARILMFSMHESKQFLEEAKKLGVHGYLIKTRGSDVLLRAVDALMLNQMFYPEPV